MGKNYTEGVSKMPKEIPYGYCHCGCGNKTNLKPGNNVSIGMIKDEPYDYLQYHFNNIAKGKSHPSWTGGKHKLSNGYIVIHYPTHPRVDARGYVYEHILVAENKIGEYLSDGMVVHHINEIKTDNRPENLMLFKNNY